MNSYQCYFVVNKHISVIRYPTIYDMMSTRWPKRLFRTDEDLSIGDILSDG